MKNTAATAATVATVVATDIEQVSTFEDKVDRAVFLARSIKELTGELDGLKKSFRVKAESSSDGEAVTFCGTAGEVQVAFPKAKMVLSKSANGATMGGLREKLGDDKYNLYFEETVKYGLRKGVLDAVSKSGELNKTASEAPNEVLSLVDLKAQTPRVTIK